MDDTMVTVVGNAVTGVDYHETPAGVPVARFRLATTQRRFDRQVDDWVDVYTSYYTVRAWRTLAVNLAASVAVGEPVLVRGSLRIRSTTSDGRGRTRVEIEATAVGHDLARGTSAFRPHPRALPTPARAAGVAVPADTSAVVSSN